MISDTEIEDLLADSFSLDLTAIVLRRQVGDQSREFRGPGYLRQTKGDFVLKVFSGDSAASQDLLSESLSTPAGTLMDSDALFGLEAVDEGGRLWRSDRVRVEGTLASGCVTGKCREIWYKRPLKITSPPAVALTFFEPLDLPGTTPLRTERQLGAEQPHFQSLRLIPRFECCGYKFDSDEKANRTRLHALKEDGPTITHLPWRIAETLEFCLGQEVRPSIIERLDEGSLCWTLIANGTRQDKSSRKPPISGKSEDFYKFFEAVFRKLLSYDDSERKRAPISRSFQYLVQMNTAAIDAQALALGVAVEGLLKVEFEDLGAPLEGFLSDLRATEEFLGESVLSKVGRARLLGAISSMRRSSAKGRLVALRNRGLIGSGAIKSWERLRHKSAHAESHSLDQEFINLCGAVRVLWHQLLFLSIGYRGPYVDYGTPGWPTRQFSRLIKENIHGPGK